MQINSKIRYEEEYLPTKCHRIPRIRAVEETVQLELRELSRKDTPVAMVVTDYKSYVDETGENQFGLRDTPYLAVDGQLFTEKRDMQGSLDKGPFTTEQFLHNVKRTADCTWSWHKNKDRESMLRDLKEFVDSHVLIDGVFFRKAGEPRYVIHTFGLGHNHGGTSLSVSNYYNENIRKDNYFNALQREEALAYARDVATKRGDTESLGTFEVKNIQVLIPEMVRCNPNLEQGNGNPLLNTVETMILAGNNTLESGLLAMAATSAHIRTENLPSLSAQIQSAENRAPNPGSSHDGLSKKLSEPEL